MQWCVKMSQHQGSCNFALVWRRKRSSHHGPLVHGGHPCNKIIFVHLEFVYHWRADAAVYQHFNVRFSPTCAILFWTHFLEFLSFKTNELKVIGTRPVWLIDLFILFSSKLFFVWLVKRECKDSMLKLELTYWSNVKNFSDCFCTIFNVI